MTNFGYDESSPHFPPTNGDHMQFYHAKTVSKTFDDAIAAVTDALKTEGFGVLTRIDMKEKLKEKLNVEYKKYVILGACNPQFAYKALQIEDKIGVMLPCNVIIQEVKGGVEVAAINPMASMAAVGLTGLGDVAAEVSAKLKRAVESL